MTGQKLSEHRAQRVGEFASEAAARAVRQKLLAGNLEPTQVYIEEQPLNTNDLIQDTGAGQGAKGGAIAGGLIGSLAGLFLALVAAKFAAVALTRTSDLILWFLGISVTGGLFGTAAFALMGALSGASARKDGLGPHTAPPQKQYFLMVQGSESQRQQAAEIVQQESNNLVP